MKPDAKQAVLDEEVRWWRSIPAKLASGMLVLTLVTGAIGWSIVGAAQAPALFEQRIGQAAAVIASAALIVLLITMLFRRLVLRRVNALMDSMARVAEGELSARVKISGNDELALLGRRFNFMAARFEQQVARMETAHTESELLYRLVVEASKSLETSEVATGVTRVIMHQLAPQRVAFFLECANGGWICATRKLVGKALLERGDGVLEDDISAASGQAQKLLQHVPPQLIAEACRLQSARYLRSAAELSAVVPIVAESRLLGLLACIGIPASIHIDRALLNNLSAHLRLAAVNSRNYTGAITDPLTGLKNKRYALARLEETISFSRRHGIALGVALCDIDHFKRVNDSYGHPAGDTVLKEVSRRMQACVRRSDVLARYGGEEFLLLLPGARLKSLEMVAEKIRRTVEQEPAELGVSDRGIPITLSIGITLLRPEEGSAVLIARADAALYRAKQSGRNRVVVDAAGIE